MEPLGLRIMRQGLCTKHSSRAGVWLGLLVIATAGLLAEHLHAQAVDGGKPLATLRVGFAGSPPFVLGTSDPEGLSIDVWRLIAERAGLDYKLVPMPSITAAINAVNAGTLDAAVGPISITSQRAELVRFSQPYFNSQLGIAAAPGSAGLWTRVKPFIGRAFAGTSLLLVCC